MSLLDKMGMWGRNSNKDKTHCDISDLFEGVDDCEDEDSDQAELSVYRKAIVNSAAYEWLIASLIRESSFHWDESQPRIMVDEVRHTILTQIPTGTISKRQAPCKHSASFELPWRTLEQRLEEECVNRGIATLGLAIPGSVVATCSSSDQIQISTVRQYMEQTWPSGGTGLLNVLQRVMDDRPGTLIRSKTASSCPLMTCMLTYLQSLFRTTQRLRPSLKTLG
jgi:hypothetical protein